MAVTTVTRKELYDKVWQIPMVKLSAELGLSGPELSKLCRRHAIPVPEIGHWTRKRAGYIDLPDPLPVEPPPETEIQLRADPDFDPVPEQHPLVREQIVYESKNPITVPDDLRGAHPMIAQAKESYASAVYRRSPINLSVSKAQRARALRLMNSLFKECEKRGFHVRVEKEEGAKIHVHGEALIASLQEPNRRSDHVLTAKEEDDKKRSVYGYSHAPRYDYTPTGNLVLTVAGWCAQRRWTDRKDRPLETRLSDVIVEMVRIVATQIRPNRLEAARREEERLENERRRWAYQKRVAAFNQSFEQWRQNREIREFLGEIEISIRKRWEIIPEGHPIVEWLSWAHALAEAGDPIPALIEKPNG